jgi:hypothetical protein
LKKPAQLIEILGLIRLILSENQQARDEYVENLKNFEETSEEYKKMEAMLDKKNDQIKTWDQVFA